MQINSKLNSKPYDYLYLICCPITRVDKKYALQVHVAKNTSILGDVTNTRNKERGTRNGERGTENGNGELETGNWKRGTGNGELETGNWKRKLETETGNGEGATENGERETENGKRRTGNGGTGDWKVVYRGNPSGNSNKEGTNN